MSELRKRGGLLGRFGWRNGGRTVPEPPAALPLPDRHVVPTFPEEHIGTRALPAPTEDADLVTQPDNGSGNAAAADPPLDEPPVEEPQVAELADEEPPHEEPPREEPPREEPPREEPPREEPAGSTPPRVAGPLEAFLRHPFLTLLPVLLLAGGAVYLGLDRKPEYTAHARVTVGNSAVPPFYLNSVVSGNQALAAGYARVLAAPPVAADVGRRMGIAAQRAAAHMSASPVAQSTLIEVEAKGPTRAFAVTLANTGAASLIGYVKRFTSTDVARALFRRFQQAQGEVRRAQRRVQAVLRSSRNSGAALTRAQLAEDSAQLRASDLSNRYRGASSDAASTSNLALIAPAASASSDRRTWLERLIAIGAVGGLLLGLGLALLRTNWGVLRALRQ